MTETEWKTKNNYKRSIAPIFSLEVMIIVNIFITEVEYDIENYLVDNVPYELK